LSVRTGKSGGGAVLAARSVVCALLLGLLAEGANAQIYNPYQTGQAAQPATGGTGQTGAAGVASVGNATGTQQTGGAGQNTNGSSQFDATGTGAGSGFNPTNIPAGLPPANAAETQVLTPTDGRNPAPLYARPAGTAGQFELFEKPPPPLSEFETFVQDEVGQPLQRFRSNLLLKQTQGFAVATTTAVPPDYALNPGDQIDIGLTGTVEANLRLVIDNEGKVFIPKIGDVNVAGIRYGDLAAAIQRRIDTQYRKVNVAVVVSRLHGITVYVTGFATTPGAYTMSSLSTMIDAVLSAGGPSSGGSYRTVELRRGGQLVSTLDLYRLLFDGDKSHDAILQNGDVLNIVASGPELAIFGSVNEPAIFEARPGESLADMLRYAGGFDGLADTSRVIVRSLADLDSGGSRQLAAANLATTPAERGDIVRVLSLARVSRPQEREFVLATVEGEVDHPGRYYLPPGSTLSDLLARAGGMTAGAYTFGTVVEREAIRKEEQASFDLAIQNLELTAAALPLQGSVVNGGPAAATSRSQGALQIIQRLKLQRPDGRLVLDVKPGGPLPVEIALENNDRVFIPPTPKTVGVFGATYKTGSFLFAPHQHIGDYVALAGGPQRIADAGDLFVVRANGSVVSLHAAHDLLRRDALPGDVIFVPVRSRATLFDKIVAVTTALSGPLFSVGTLLALGL
jgi:protein involved in polysaccharide export with SLBB domain